MSIITAVFLESLPGRQWGRWEAPGWLTQCHIWELDAGNGRHTLNFSTSTYIYVLYTYIQIHTFYGFINFQDVERKTSIVSKGPPRNIYSSCNWTLSVYSDRKMNALTTLPCADIYGRKRFSNFVVIMACTLYLSALPARELKTNSRVFTNTEFIWPASITTHPTLTCTAGRNYYWAQTFSEVTLTSLQGREWGMILSGYQIFLILYKIFHVLTNFLFNFNLSDTC